LSRAEKVATKAVATPRPAFRHAPIRLKWNEKFAVEPSETVSAYRPLTKTEDGPDLLLARRKERVLSMVLTFSYGGTKYWAI
jgi:hypothetical protein